jgi:hypothetical protein
MYLIKTCPDCKTKIRFPIDKGTIRVKCACGYNFIADPDGTDIYKDASFDLSHSSCGLKKMSPLKNAINNIKINQVIPSVINRVLDVKYKLLNFRLLPDAEKKKIILSLLLVCAGTALFAITIYLLTRGPGSCEKIII